MRRYCTLSFPDMDETRSALAFIDASGRDKTRLVSILALIGALCGTLPSAEDLMVEHNINVVRSRDKDAGTLIKLSVAYDISSKYFTMLVLFWEKNEPQMPFNVWLSRSMLIGILNIRADSRLELIGRHFNVFGTDEGVPDLSMMLDKNESAPAVNGEKISTKDHGIAVEKKEPPKVASAVKSLKGMF